MYAEITQINKTDKIDGDDTKTTYKMVMKNTDKSQKTRYGDVKMTVSMESESREALAQFCTMEIGESRQIEFNYINHTMDEFMEDAETKMAKLNV